MAPDPHELVSCPYNEAHVVERYRLQYHLDKCRKQYPNCKKVTCPYDATHIVNDVELDHHVQNVCSKRYLLDTLDHVTEDDSTPIQKIVVPPPLQSDENWDDDDVPSFKPDPSKMGNHILKKPPKGVTPSERRKVRMEGIRTFRAPDAPQ